MTYRGFIVGEAPIRGKQSTIFGKSSNLKMTLTRLRVEDLEGSVGEFRIKFVKVNGDNILYAGPCSARELATFVVFDREIMPGDLVEVCVTNENDKNRQVIAMVAGTPL